MGLNETLDRLKHEREMMELRSERTPEQEATTILRDEYIRHYAERIFFDRMLKDINNGMSGPKIDALIDRSIMIASRLVDKLYRQ